MSEQELEDERGESYLEIQMDRSTIVLAALGLLVLLAGAFLLGSWFGSRDRDGDDAVARASAPAEDAAAGEEEIAAEEHDGEDVTGESGFGGTPVSARGAPPVGAVPTPRRASAPGPATLLAEEEVPSPKASAPRSRGTAPKVTAPKATAPRASAPKPTAAAAAKASAPAADGEWIVQVAAVQDRAEAEQLATRLRRKGWALRVVEEAGYVKVQVGPYDSQAAARTAETRLKREERLGTWVKRG